ncbi:ParB/RepB/Spo0J family partition protein, partial [Acinetobacter baumannii]
DRKKVNPVAWAAFVATIKDKGVLEPILVRFVPETGQFQLIAGYGRWEGAIEAHGLDYDMPIRVLDADDVEATALALIENIHREDMTPIEEAEAAA